MCLRIYSYISQILRTASLFNGDSAELLKTCQGKLKSLYKRLNCGNLYEVLKLIAIEETGVEKSLLYITGSGGDAGVRQRFCRGQHRVRFGFYGLARTEGHRAAGFGVTTNGSFSNQTFGITFGTSGCDPEGRVTGGTQKMVLAFIENNMEQYALDASRGSGETIDTLAGILNMDKSVLGAKSQQNFAVLFPNENVQAVDVTLSLFEILKA